MQFTKYVSIAILASAVGSAWASPIVPTFDSFGSLPGATFGGSGIPNTAVAITTLGNVTLGLTAHQRYGNPALTNDGAGTFRALPGADTNPPSPADPYASWNFGFYVGGSDLSYLRYTYWLFYDFDPAADTEQADHGSGWLLTNQGSLNLGMDFLATSFWPLVSAPAFPSFDPNARGEYSFALAAYDWRGNEAGRSAIRVLVGDVPEPGSLALVGIALLGLAGIGLRVSARFTPLMTRNRAGRDRTRKPLI